MTDLHSKMTNINKDLQAGAANLKDQALSKAHAAAERTGVAASQIHDHISAHVGAYGAGGAALAGLGAYGAYRAIKHSKRG